LDVDLPPRRLPNENLSIDILDLPDELLTGVEVPLEEVVGRAPISGEAAVVVFAEGAKEGAAGGSSTTTAESVEE